MDNYLVIRKKEDVITLGTICPPGNGCPLQVNATAADAVPDVFTCDGDDHSFSSSTNDANPISDG